MTIRPVCDDTTGQLLHHPPHTRLPIDRDLQPAYFSSDLLIAESD
jgi:hypothetical protein